MCQHQSNRFILLPIQTFLTLLYVTLYLYSKKSPVGLISTGLKIILIFTEMVVLKKIPFYIKNSLSTVFISVYNFFLAFLFWFICIEGVTNAQ